MNERISVNPKICHGQVCIKGTRIPVHQVIRMLANGDKIEELLEDYPSLKVEDIYVRDMQWLEECDVMIAEVSTPSLRDSPFSDSSTKNLDNFL